jgi:hypothetical protein
VEFAVTLPLKYSPLGLPWSGDVMQNMTSWWSPTINNNYAGNLPLEERVITDVASYGTQLGWISEIVLALASNKKPPAGAVHKLSKAVDRINRIKQDFSQRAADEAADALDKLKNESPDEFRRFVTDQYNALARAP